jgi:hypothetical protein
MKEMHRGTSSVPVLIAAIVLIAALAVWGSWNYEKVTKEEQKIEEIQQVASSSQSAAESEEKAEVATIRSRVIGTWEGADDFEITFVADGTYVAEGNVSEYGTSGTWKVLTTLKSEVNATPVQRSLADGSYLKIFAASNASATDKSGKMNTKYYVIGMASAQQLRYVDIAAKEATIVDLSRVK